MDSVEAERRRIERDLHDGPQQRLVAIAMDLGWPGSGCRPTPAGWRSSWTGPTPRPRRPSPTCAGSPAASTRPCSPTEAWTPRCRPWRPAPPSRSRSTSRPGPRPPARLEAIAYFSVSEALTNVAKHSGATSARVDVATRRGRRPRRPGGHRHRRRPWRRRPPAGQRPDRAAGPGPGGGRRAPRVLSARRPDRPHRPAAAGAGPAPPPEDSREPPHRSRGRPHRDVASSSPRTASCCARGWSAC